MVSNIEYITREIQKYAMKARYENSSESFLHHLKNYLNLVFGADKNHIVNIRESDSLVSALNSLAVTVAAVNAGDEELVNKVLDAAQKAIFYQAIIYFPIITIVNENGLSHTIRDLYVRLKFDVTGKLIQSPEGIRTTATRAEISSQYCHSHLRRISWDFMAFQEFCTGEGPINATVINLKERFDQFELQVLLNQINQLVRWESIEGVPFIQIEEIKRHEGVLVSVTPKHNTSITKGFIDFLRTMPASDVAQLFNFSYGITVMLSAKESLEDYLLTFLEQREGYESTDVVYKERTGQYYSFVNMESPTNTVPNLDTDRVVLKFKNISKRLKLIENEEIIETRKFPNPGYTKDICDELSKQFRTVLGRKNRDVSECAHSYTRQSLATNSASAS